MANLRTNIHCGLKGVELHVCSNSGTKPMLKFDRKNTQKKI